MEMPNRTRLVVLILVVLTTSSCDPSKTIIVRNISQGNGIFKLEWKRDKATINHQVTEFNLAPGESSEINAVNFGRVYWQRKEIIALTDLIESIDISGPNTAVKLETKDEIHDFLRTRRHGLFHCYITIDIR
jgi:hypothetical protein